MQNFFELLKYETKRHSIGFTIFVLVWIVLSAMFLAFFDGLKASADQLISLYETLPKELLSAFGKDATAITNIYGYFGTAIMLYLSLSGSIFAVVAATNSLAGEIANNSIIFILSKPIGRLKIYAAKVVALLINLFASNIALCLATVVLVQLFTKETDVDNGFFVAVFVGLFLLESFFAGLAYSLSMLIGTKATAVVTFTVLLSYLFNLVAGLTPSAELLRYISPNYYIDFDEVITSHALSPLFLVVWLAAVVAILLGAHFFRNKDIN